MDDLPCARDAGIRELVMKAHWRRQDQEQPEGQAGKGVAEHLATDLLRQHGVPRQVGGQQPEVDERVAKEPEQGSRELGVDTGDEPKRPWEQKQEDLGGNTECRDLPQCHRDHRSQRDERRPDAWIVLPPSVERQVHAEPFHPASHDDQREADIEQARGLHGRVERVQDRGRVSEERHGGDHEANDHGQEPDPVDDRIAQGPAETLRQSKRQESSDEERGPYQSVQDTVKRETLVVGVDQPVELGVQIKAGVLKCLQRAELDAESQRGERYEYMPTDKAALLLVKLVRRLQCALVQHFTHPPMVLPRLSRRTSPRAQGRSTPGRRIRTFRLR